ncbi:unnamed protein product [Trichogramma brassicae]|uniref:RNA-directed DNA polymerase n=1 Tax=Trichogramma brassicae TaxID=86971 RepID=A0A6H5HTW5_9HYME|nr:unnamed protein product [Trichogramma brassicae]
MTFGAVIGGVRLLDGSGCGDAATFLSRAEERNKGRKISKGVQVNTTSRVFYVQELSLSTERATHTHSLCSDQFLAPRRKTFGVTVFSPRECSKITKSAVSRSGRIRTRIRPIQTHHGRTRQLLTVRVVAEATASIFHEQTEPSHVKTTHSSSLSENPLFQAMARAPAVNAVGNCRLPAFWRSDPDLWFLQVEAQFNIHQVTSDSTRFNMILTVLDPETISEVSDIIRAPPVQDKYTTLKDAIVARLTDSPDTQLHKLLGTIELGDKKPSQLLLQMRTLAGARASNDILRVRWLDLLPDSTRRLLTIIKNQTIDELAAVADELHAAGTLGDGHRVWTTALETGIARRRCLFKFKFSWSAGNRRAPRCDRPTDRNYARSSPTSRSASRSLSLENSTTLAVTTSLTNTRIEARPRGYCWCTTRDTATWQSSARGSRTSLSTSCQVGPAPPVHTISVAATGVPVGPCASTRTTPYSLNLRATERAQARWPRSSTSRCNIESSRPDSPSLPAPRRLAGDRLAAAKAEFKKLLDRGIIRPSSSQWASPLHLVPKPGNTWRITGDYRLLNARTQPDRHPLPIIEDLLQESVGKVFSVVDLYKAFYQIPVAEEDISKTAVTTPFGLFEFVGMPLGLRNSAQTFQRTMNYLLRDLDFVRCYQDDILVLSASHEQHLQHLRELLTILKRARLFVNWEKCQIGRSEVVFAGYLISERGFEPPAAKVEAIARFPKPSDSTQLRRFIGMLNFYRRCLPRAAELMSPLTDLLRGLQKKKEKLAWSAQADEAFERIKQAMASAYDQLSTIRPASCSAHRRLEYGYWCRVESARHADDDWTPLGFFSQKLSPTQQRYSTYDRELLAIFEAIKYFQRILEGRSFTIMTDHRPLSFALEQKSDKFSPRQSRQLDFISRFDAKIVYTPGDENPSGIGKFRHTGRPIRSCAHRHRQDASSPRISKLPHDDRPLHTLATGHPDRRHVCTNRSQSFFPRMDFIFWHTPLTLTITTDQGAQFEGKLLAQLCKLVGAKHVHTSPYHPQANSMVERMHRTLKAALKCSPETPWTLALPGVLLGLRTTFKEDLQASPAEMVFGTSLRIPGEFVARQEPDKTSPSEFVSALRRLFQAIRPVPASRHVQHRPFVFKDLATSDYVFRRLDTILKPLEQPYTGPTQSHPPHQRAKLCRRRKWRRQDALYRSAQASLPGCRRQRSITGNTGAANYHAAFINTESHLFTPCANCPVH